MEHRGYAPDNFCFHRSNVGKDIGVQRIRVAEETEDLQGFTHSETDEISWLTYGIVDFGGVILHHLVNAARDFAR